MKLSKLSVLQPTALLFGLVLILGGAIARGSDDDAQEEVEAPVEAEEPAQEMSSAPRVFFTNLTEGEEVTSPVSLEFGIENFEIVPAQDPVVIEEGKGHHHVGINTHCLPAGTVIEKADPWVHFGDGSNTIDVQLPPGEAHLALQVGDGEHRTLDEEGLCAMINITIIEEGV